MAGLEPFAKHRISEGIELTADYARNMKQHGSQKRIVPVMNMLKQYGTHAQRVIPQLEKTARYYSNDEEDFPKKLSLQKAKIIRNAIQKIKASTQLPELRSVKDK